MVSFPPSERWPGSVLPCTIPYLSSLPVCRDPGAGCCALTYPWYIQACKHWLLPPSAGTGEKRVTDSAQHSISKNCYGVLVYLSQLSNNAFMQMYIQCIFRAARRPRLTSVHCNGIRGLDDCYFCYNALLSFSVILYELLKYWCSMLSLKKKYNRDLQFKLEGRALRWRACSVAR